MNQLLTAAVGGDAATGASGDGATGSVVDESAFAIMSARTVGFRLRFVLPPFFDLAGFGAASPTVFCDARANAWKRAASFRSLSASRRSFAS